MASRVVTFGQLTNSALGLAAQPRLARLLAAGDRDGANELYRTTTAWIILLNGPLYLTVAFSPRCCSECSDSSTSRPGR